MKNKFIQTLTIFLLTFFAASCLEAGTNDFSKTAKSTQFFSAEDFLGAANSAIPIVVPPGRKGIQPQIGLQYSSTSANGWLGVGWSFDFGYIERSIKSSVPKFDSSDRYYISFSGINAELETHEALPNEYYPVNTSTFIKILYRNDYWEAYDKDGKKYVFGATQDSKITTSKGTFRWALNKIIDTCGNYLTITYSRDGYQIYPAKVEYTGNALTAEAPKHKVEFILEARQDTSSNYRSGFHILTTKRLREIKTYASGQLAGRYLLEYIYSTQTKRSLLAKFTQFGSDGTTSLPAMEFNYQQTSTPAFRFSSVSEEGSNNKRWVIQRNFGPLWTKLDTPLLTPKGADPDGKTLLAWDNVNISTEKTGSYWSVDDKASLNVNLGAGSGFCASTFIYVTAAKTISIPAQGAAKYYFWLNGDYSASVNPQQINLKEGSNLLQVTGYSINSACTFNLNYALADNVIKVNSFQHAIPQLAGDFNGDGRTDIATYYGSDGSIKVALSNGEEFLPGKYWEINPGYSFPKYQGMDSVLLGDFNGDTRTDIRAISSTMQAELALSYGDSFVDQGGGGKAKFSVKGKPFAADFNNDGVTDIAIQATGSNDIIVSLCYAPYNMNTPTTWLANFPGKIIPGDFNADGLVDLAAYDSAQQTIKVALNKGGAFEAPAVWLTGINTTSDLSISECNNDGMSDIIYYDKPNGRVMAAYSQGAKFSAPVVYLSGFSLKDADTLLQVADFNGDGVNDFYAFNPSTLKTELVYSKSNFTDLLVKSKNGLGSELSITYDTSANFDNTITKDITSEYEYKNLKGQGLPFAVAVVKEIDTSDGLGNIYKSFYSYKGGFFDRNDREFRGFGYVGITDSSGNQKALYFKQDDYYKGKLYREEQKDAAGNLFSRVENVWYYQPMTTDCINSTPQLGRYIYLSQQYRYSFDGDSTYKKAYSSYGYSSDISRQCIKGDLISSAEGGDGSGDRIRSSDFVHTGTESILSRPSYVYTYNGDGGRIFSKKWLYYDNNTNFSQSITKGLLIKEKICLAASDTSNTNDIDPAIAPITTYAYDTYGNLTSTTDPENHTTTTTYDSTYHIYPVEAKNALGHIVKNTYDAKTGQVLTSTDANKQITTYVYDTLGRLSKVIGPQDSAQYPGIIYEYDLSSRPIKHIKKYKTAYPSTYFVEYSFYDSLGRLLQTKVDAEDDSATAQPRQVVKDAIAFDQQGRAKEKYNPYFVAASSTYSAPSASQTKTVFSYDCLGRATQVTNPDATYRSVQYSDWVETRTDENGHQNRTTYDAFGRIVKKEEFNSGSIYTTSYGYDLITYDNDARRYRKVFQVTDNNNNVTQVFYDLADRKLKMIDPDMGTWYYAYDKAGNLLSQKDAKNQTIAFTYDALNRVNKKAYPDGKSIAYTYDDTKKTYCLGRLSSVADLSGTSSYYYDNLGRAVKTVKTVDSVQYAVSKVYDALDRTTKLTYPDGEAVSYTYNKANGTEKISGYVNNVNYSASGQITRVDYANSTYTDRIYNPANLRLTDLKTNNGALQSLNYKYDKVGNISDIRDYKNTATQSFLYDDLNRLTRASGAYGTFGYAYDAIGNMTAKEGSSYNYGSAKPHALMYGTDFSGSYDANGNMTARNGEALSYDYDNRLQKYCGKSGNDVVTVDIPLTFGWNFFSLPVVPGDSSIGAVFSSVAGKFDQVSRRNTAANTFEHYIVGSPKYSSFNNLEVGRGYQVYVTSTSGCTLKVIGKPLATTFSTTMISGWQMIGYPGKTKIKVSDALSGLVKGTNYDRLCRYDKTKAAFVELAATDYLDPGQSYYIRILKSPAWTISVKSDIVDYVYDASGDRVKKIVNGAATIYIGSLYEKTGSLITKYIYLGEDRIAGVSLRGSGAAEAIYYHSDHLGSSNLITNSSGAVVQLSEYKPYGELSVNSVIASPAGAKQSYYFTGKELDSTGLYYYGARYYDPMIGRFITPDNFIAKPYNPQYFNRYSYCMNNPLRYIDPTGNYSWDNNFGFGNFIDTYKDYHNSFPSEYKSFTNPKSILNTTYSDNLISSLWQEVNIGYSAYGMGCDYGINSLLPQGTFRRNAYDNITEPINNALTRPGHNYGMWMYGEQNLKSFYGACLDSAWLISGIYGAIGSVAANGAPYWRYIGPESNPTYSSSGKLLNKTWLTRGWEVPYNDLAIAKDKLQLPYMPTSVEQVKVPFFRYVAGPGKAWRNPKFGSGGGSEYRAGGWYDYE